MVNSELNEQDRLRCLLHNADSAVEECDATKLNSSNEAD
jgi:hypothetical protein